ncbi:MAG: hypothetical protein FJZ01_02125 [Candidatus Sericytochromatia bacterium]|nr:hypothetical protein [Candidatus Tanganyikabacteria bacterium]
MRLPANSRPRSSAGLTFDLAAPADEPELRRLMRECHLEGEITLAVEREPDFFLGQTIEGPAHQTLVARDPEGRIAGMGSRSVREVWIDGHPRRMGYLGQLRLEPAYRGLPRIMRSGWKLLRRLHEEGDVPFYLTSISETNAAARRLLEAGLPGFPTYRPVAELATLVVSTGRGATVPGTEVTQAEAGDLAEIAELLARYHSAHQFAPIWTAEDLANPERVRGLVPEDFLLVRQAGRLVGCAALWDQRAYKQVRVHGYASHLGRWRPALDLASRMVGLPPLPRPGEPLEMAYLSHLAADREAVEVYLALIGAARARAAGRGLASLALGLSAGSPLLAALRQRLRFIEYRTLLYLVHWEDGAGAASAIGPRLARPEIAVL